MEKGLIKKEYEGADAFYSKKLLEDELNNPETESDVNMALDYFIDQNPDYKKAIDLNARLYRLSGKAILLAHGTSSEDGVDWHYEADKYRSVQDWIDSKDGHYSALILLCCNPGSYEISSKYSAVIAPNNTHSYYMQEQGECKPELYIPEIGYLDSYIKDDQIKELENKVNEK